jgi:PKD repeat protein
VLSFVATAAFAQDPTEADQSIDAAAQTTATTYASATAPVLHGLGALPPKQTVPPIDYSRIVLATALPASVDLRQWVAPVGDQGAVGSCTAWATSHGMMGWYAKRLGMAQTAFAPMYMYSQINVCKDQRMDCGSYITDGFDLAKNQGVDTDSDYLPQGDYNWWDQPTVAQRTNAANYKMGEWSTLFSVWPGGGINGQTAIQAALANSQPVVIAFPVRPGFDNLSPINILDTDTTGASRGLHAILAVGYDQDGLLIQNSWGTGWGLGGFGRLSWAVVQQDVYEAHTFNQAFGKAKITPTVGAGGTISPATPVQVPPGSTTTFTVTPSSGYTIDSVTGCGGNLNGNVYTTGPITADCTVAATFKSPSIITVSTSTGTGGDISPTSTLVSSGQRTTFTVTPYSGYTIASVTGCNGLLSGNTYTTGTITANCTVSVTFTKATTLPPTVNLSVSPTSIVAGGSATLSWSSTNASTCTAAGGWTGSKNVSSSTTTASTGAVSSTTTYTLTCANAYGSTSASTTLTVGALPTVNLSVSPTSIAAGGSATLSWSSTNANTCTASGGWTGSKNVSSSTTTASISAVSSTTTYTLTCSNTYGSTSASTTLTVTGAKPTVNLSVSPTSIVAGGSATLSWSSTNANTCTASGGWSGSKNVSSSTTTASTGVVSSTTTYTLTCSNAYGSTSASVTLTVSTSSTYYTVTPIIGMSGYMVTGDGLISPTAPVPVKAGSTVSFTLQNPGAYTLRADVSGTCAYGEWTGPIVDNNLITYTTGPITADCTAVFPFDRAYTITPSAGAGGTISPATPVAGLSPGETESFTITANSGHTLVTPVGGTCVGTLSGTGPSYTYKVTVTGNCTVSATFR